MADARRIRVEYSVDGGLWLIAGYGPGRVCTPPMKSGVTVCMRSRVERDGYAPSDYEGPKCTAVAAGSPVLYSLSIVIDEEYGSPIVRWTRNSLALGVRLDYEIHDPLVTPTYGTSVDVDAAPGEYGLPDPIVSGERISVRATPYTGFSIGAVSGTAGTPRFASRNA